MKEIIPGKLLSPNFPERHDKTIDLIISINSSQSCNPFNPAIYHFIINFSTKSTVLTYIDRNYYRRNIYYEI